MPALEFLSAPMRRLIDHAKAAPDHSMGYEGGPKQPALILVGDQGVYLMSNGLPRDVVAPSSEQSFVVHAQGHNPKINHDWYEAKSASFGADDGADTLDIVEDVDLLLRRGEETIRIEITTDHVGLLVPDMSWAKPGMMVAVPSGLGGSFHARIEEITEIDALVKNSGNSGDFDQAPPYRVPLAQLRKLKAKGAA